MTVKGQRLQVVDKLTYLGSTSSKVAHFADKVNARVAKYFVEVFGIEVESDLNLSSSSWCLGRVAVL